MQAGKLETFYTNTSSMFTHVTYEPDKKGEKGTLKVFLRNHTEYEYRQIPSRMWQELKRAASSGSYYNTYIKNVYQYVRKN